MRLQVDSLISRGNPPESMQSLFALHWKLKHPSSFRQLGLTDCSPYFPYHQPGHRTTTTAAAAEPGVLKIHLTNGTAPHLEKRFHEPRGVINIYAPWLMVSGIWSAAVSDGEISRKFCPAGRLKDEASCSWAHRNTDNIGSGSSSNSNSTRG